MDPRSQDVFPALRSYWRWQRGGEEAFYSAQDHGWQGQGQQPVFVSPNVLRQGQEGWAEECSAH